MTHISKLGAALTATLIVIAFGATPARAQLIYTSDFEGGSLQCSTCNPDGWTTSSYFSNAILVQTTPVLPMASQTGRYALRVHADKNDPWGGNSPRAEIKASAHSFFEMEKEYWVGWSIC